MDSADFKSGAYNKQIEYQSFSPAYINHPWIISSPEINKLLAEANRLIGELNAFSESTSIFFRGRENKLFGNMF